MVENFCSRAEIDNDDRDEAEWLSIPLSDLRILVNEIISIRAKRLLHLLPVDILVRLLRVLDHQIHRAEGLSINDCEHVSFLYYLSKLQYEAYSARLLSTILKFL